VVGLLNFICITPSFAICTTLKMTNERQPEPTALDASASADTMSNAAAAAAAASFSSDLTTVLASNLETDRPNANDDAPSAELNSHAAVTVNNSSRRTIDSETAGTDALQTFQSLALADTNIATATMTTTTPVTHSETMLLGTIPEVAPFGTEPLPTAARTSNRPSPVTTTTTPRGRVVGGGSGVSLPRPYNLAPGTTSPLEPAAAAASVSALNTPNSAGGGFLTSPHNTTSFDPLSSSTPTRCINSANGTYLFIGNSSFLVVSSFLVLFRCCIFSSLLVLAF
jgi:hypothetical protein